LPPDPEWAGREEQSGSEEWTDPRGDPDPAAALDEIARSAPSLPIILISAAAGVSAAVICFYFASQLAGFGLPLSAAAATLGLSFGLGGTGGVLSWASGSRAAAGNIALSCAVILLVLAFFGLCVFAGAIAAALLLAVQI
jgi:hypothetical protein